MSTNVPNNAETSSASSSPKSEILISGVAILFLLLGVANQPSKWRCMYFFPIMGCCVMLYKSSANHGKPFLPPELVSIILMQGSDYILLSEVQRELRQQPKKRRTEPTPHPHWNETPNGFNGGVDRNGHIITNDSSKRKAGSGPMQTANFQIEDRPFIDRLKWSLNLLTHMRGIGWSHEPTRSLPALSLPLKSSRIRFLLNRAAWGVLYTVLFDVGLDAIQRNSAFYSSSAGQRQSLHGWSYIWRFVTMVQLAVTADSALALVLNIVPACLFVGCGISEPKEWPHLFGSVLGSKRVRMVWGFHWHQLLRRPLLVHGKFIAHQVLRLQLGSYPSRFVQVTVAFLISGLMHTRSTSELGAIKFFLAQATCIAVEDFGLHVLQRFSPTKSRSIPMNVLGQVLGHIWICVWFVYSIPWFFDSLANTGFFDDLRKVDGLGIATSLRGLLSI